MNRLRKSYIYNNEGNDSTTLYVSQPQNQDRSRGIPRIYRRKVDFIFYIEMPSSPRVNWKSVFPFPYSLGV